MIVLPFQVGHELGPLFGETQIWETACIMVLFFCKLARSQFWKTTICVWRSCLNQWVISEAAVSCNVLNATIEYSIDHVPYPIHQDSPFDGYWKPCPGYMGFAVEFVTLSHFAPAKVSMPWPWWVLLCLPSAKRQLPSGKQTLLMKVAIEIVDLPIENGDFP